MFYDFALHFKESSKRAINSKSAILFT